MKNKYPNQDTINRLLVAKYFLDDIKSLPNANPDRYTIARYVLVAHDAAELSIAGIANHLGFSSKKDKFYLMDYIGLIYESYKKGDVPGRSFFSQLNTARNAFKHNGNFPDKQQWFRVGETTYKYISDCCTKYLKISFYDLDESDMIIDLEAKKHYDTAKKFFIQKDFQKVFENLAYALFSIFEKNKALRNLVVGVARVEDAIKVSSFGVHANEFLALQEFLPRIRVSLSKNRTIGVDWEQKEFGHPANWREDSAEFSLKAFVKVALRIQDAEWIPGAIPFDRIYKHKITALTDNVEIIQKRTAFLKPDEKIVLRTLAKGESIRGKVEKKDSSESLVAAYLGKEYIPMLSFINYHENIIGEVEEKSVRVTCVPKEDEFIKKYFSHLKEIDFK